MNLLLQDKFDELNNAKDYECWYLVKQLTKFEKICYLVSFLEEYQQSSKETKLEKFIKNKVQNLTQYLGEGTNYRALRVASFLGLITPTSSRYEEAIITESFIEIKQRCLGKFENIYEYTDIIERQIEKMFVSSDNDNENNGVRQEFRLYPVMLLYKVLLELGRADGEYKISIDEYKYLVATTKTFENFLETLILIKLYRKDTAAKSSFAIFNGKFDNRFIQVLKQLPTLEINNDYIVIREDKINEVAKKHDGGGHPLASGANAYSKEEIEEVYQELKELAKRK